MRLPFSNLRLLSLFLGLASTVILTEMFVVQSATFARRPDWVSLGVTLDIAVGLPVLYYFLLVRRLNLPIRSVLAIFGLALALTALILPATNQQLVSLLRRALLLAEIGSVGYILLRTRQIVQHYRQLSRSNADFIQNLAQSLDLALGYSRFNRILVSELALLRYGLFAWSAPVEKTQTETDFTSHKNSGQIALTAGLISIGLIETFIVHLLVQRWNPVVAWFLTGLGLYGLLFFVADAVATIKRPVLVRPNEIVVRFGLRGYGLIDRQNIKAVNAITDKPKRDATTVVGTLLTTPNVLIRLQEPIVITGPLGRQKMATCIALFIDDIESFHQMTA